MREKFRGICKTGDNHWIIMNKEMTSTNGGKNYPKLIRNPFPKGKQILPLHTTTTEGLELSQI